jgi:hypothetical protein
MPEVLADYTRFPALEALPALVRKQRRLEGQIAPLGHLVDDEKTIRHTIDALLLAEGFTRGEGVTCNGYDVVHRDQKGRTTLNATTLTGKLVEAGLTMDAVLTMLLDSTDTGDPPQWAEVKPSRGAKVRA